MQLTLIKCKIVAFLHFTASSHPKLPPDRLAELVSASVFSFSLPLFCSSHKLNIIIILNTKFLAKDACFVITRVCFFHKTWTIER